MSQPLPIPDVPPAQASTILCGPWASPSNIPETFRAKASDDQWVTILRMAAEQLYELTGRQWRGEGCTDRMILRSRPSNIGSALWPAAWTCGCWYRLGGSWGGSIYDSWGYSSAWRGGHPSPTAVQLEVDTTAITSVVLGDATVIDPSAYRLSKSGWLERVDGKAWSVCGVTGPTTITYTKGDNPPMGGIVACVTLAIELVKSWCGEQCAIPQNATQVVRQGISITLDPSVYLKERRTGVPAVDTWIESVNPTLKGGGRRTMRAAVWTPDMPTGTRIGPPA